jgi:hypothetical protein
MSSPKDSRDGRFGRQPENMAIPQLLRAMAGGALHKESGTDVVLRQAADELDEAWNEIETAVEMIAEAAALLHESTEPLKAHGMRLGQCSNPECKLVHLALTDEEDRPIATGVIKSGELRQMIHWCREAGIEP